MSTKEIRIPHNKIRDTQTITDVQERAFKDAGLDMHRDELIGEELIDDHSKGVRVLKVRGKVKYFDMGRK